MRKPLTTTFVILVICLISCEQASKETSQIITPIPERRMYSESIVKHAFDSIRPARQAFLIKGEKDTLISGTNGTSIAISKNTFINAQGGIVAGSIDIELVEVNSIADIIGANLQTTSGDKILQTGGMFFIDAKSQGLSLKIRENKSIDVEVKDSFINTEMKLFSGSYDSAGRISWKKSGDLENRLISIPLNLLNFNYGAWECWYNEEQIKLLTNPKFKNTYIATREFEYRARVLDYCTCPQMEDLDDELLNIYTSNIDKTLSYADSLVANYIFTTYKDLIDTTKEFSFNDTGWLSHMYKSALQFSKQNLLNPIDFDQVGISAKTTSEDLMGRGIPENEASKLINLYKMRTKVIQELEDKNATQRLGSYSFSINQLGWINIDWFLDDSNTIKSDFVVKLNSQDTLEYVSLSLVIPNYNIAVFSLTNEQGMYSFTKKQNGYRRLPVGEDAILVAFSYKNNKPYFGKKKIKIPATGEIELKMELTNQSNIKATVAKLTE